MDIFPTQRSTKLGNICYNIQRQLKKYFQLPQCENHLLIAYLANKNTMALSKTQIKYIEKNKPKYSPAQLAEKLDAGLEDIESYLEKHEEKKYPFWFYLIALLIPVLFFVLLEGTLRIIDYGKNLDTFITVSEDYPDKLVLNPDVPYKYFSNLSGVPSVIPDIFDEEKTDSTYRVFVLGGSSTAGWPYPNNVTFSRYLQRRLELIYHKKNIEVINLSMSAINSYTLLDFLPQVIEHKPDLLLIYAGHNEYYGALGAGSSIKLGSSPGLVNFVIWLREFKTTQMLRDVIGFTAGLFASGEIEKPQHNETLMSQMIGESTIPLNSDTYQNGIEQFEANIDAILSTANDNGIPVIIGSLASNLKQKPFVSVTEEKENSAEILFEKAKNLLSNKDTTRAKELFIKAKDADALRFRAPSDINSVIERSANKYNAVLIDIDSVLSANTDDGIVGYNLMVDHLHPNVEGYTLIGKAFFDKIKESGYMPGEPTVPYTDEVQVKMMARRFPYTELDSVISDLKIRRLVGSHPFVPEGQPNMLLRGFKMDTLIDSVAVEVAEQRISWQGGHKKIAEYYYKNRQYDKFAKEADAIIKNRPYDELNYVFIVSHLINVNRYNQALPYLYKLHKLNANDYTTKWLGAVYLEKKQYSQAVKYLEESVEYNDKDAQVYYNLSGAYYLTNQLDKAIEAINKCLELKPNYPNAGNFKQGLIGLKEQSG